MPAKRPSSGSGAAPSAKRRRVITHNRPKQPKASANSKSKPKAPAKSKPPAKAKKTKAKKAKASATAKASEAKAKAVFENYKERFGTFKMSRKLKTLLQCCDACKKELDAIVSEESGGADGERQCSWCCSEVGAFSCECPKCEGVLCFECRSKLVVGCCGIDVDLTVEDEEDENKDARPPSTPRAKQLRKQGRKGKKRVKTTPEKKLLAALEDAKSLLPSLHLSDGEIPQLKSLLRLLHLYAALNNRQGKSSASASSTQQALDACVAFMVLKAYNKTQQKRLRVEERKVRQAEQAEGYLDMVLGSPTEDEGERGFDLVGDDFKNGLKRLTKEGMPPLSDKHKTPLLQFLRTFPKMFRGAFAPKHLTEGWRIIGASPLCFETMVKQCKAWKGFTDDRKAKVRAALPALKKLALSQQVEDADMEAALGFNDGTRLRGPDAPLHKKRAVWFNSDNEIHKRIVAALEERKTKTEKIWATRRNQLWKTISEARKAVHNLSKDNALYCFCLEEDAEGDDYWQCDSSATYCPFRRYIHKSCAQELGEDVSEEQEEYFCFFCKLFPQPPPKKRKPKQRLLIELVDT